MSRSVRILPLARADFRGIYTYIERRSTDGAARWRQSFDDAVARIRSNPDLGGRAPESNLVAFELRQILFKTHRGKSYRLVYTSQYDEILILRIRGPGQAPLSADDLSVQDS